MKRIGFVLLGVSLAVSAVADDGSDFVAAFSAAVNGKDRKAWEAFLSPGSRACLSGPGKEALDRIFRNDTSERVAPDSKVYVTHLNPNEVLMFEGMLTYPDRPTHYFQINLGPPGQATRSLIRYGRLQNGRWQYVLGCPKADGIFADGKDVGQSGGKAFLNEIAKMAPHSKVVPPDSTRSGNSATVGVVGSIELTNPPREGNKPAHRPRSNMDARECLKHEDNAAIMACANNFR